jgi:Ca-activated chloride channel family protein
MMPERWPRQGEQTAMPVRNRTLDFPPGLAPGESIRDTLEADAWRRHPEFSARLARRQPTPQRHRRALRWQDRALLIIGIILMALLLIRIETAAADETWGLELQAGTQHWSGMVLETRISADVTGLVARVEVTQSFSNPGDAFAEGIYRFPLPPGAAVDRLLVQVGGRVIEGEIRERQDARRVYQQARDTGRTASLIEQQRPNQFESRLANIGPGERIQVTIGFLVNVDFAEGMFSLRMPMTFTPRWTPEVPGPLDPPAPDPVLASAAAGAHMPLELEVLLHTAMAYGAIESRYHDVEITPEAQGYRVRLLQQAYLPDRDFELAWAPELGAFPQPELLTFNGGDAVYAQLMLVPPVAQAVGPQPREVVFVIDTSGSMEGDSLSQATAALFRGLDELDVADYFNLIQFNSETEALFARPVAADRPNLAAARDYLAALEANGGTVMAPALEAALSMPRQDGLLRQVVFITDGSVGNERELLGGIAERLGEARLFTVGIGSAPNSWFMRKAAEIGRGRHTHIGRLDEVEARMSALWLHIRLPALSDVCVDWGVGAEYYPEVIPDLYAGEPLWLTARLPMQPRDVLVCGEFNGAYWEHPVTPRAAAGAETLATLWARRKLEALEDNLMFGGDPKATRAEMTAVALEHGLLTRHTSLVAVDKTPVRAPGEALDSETIPSLLPAGSTLSTAGFPATATGWLAQALLSTLTLLIATGLFLFSGARLPLDPSRAAAQTSLG